MINKFKREVDAIMQSHGDSPLYTLSVNQLRPIFKHWMLETLQEIQPEPEDKDLLMKIEDLMSYLPDHPARQTIYDWIFRRKIPFEKFGKRVYFRKSVIDTWLAAGRQMK